MAHPHPISRTHAMTQLALTLLIQPDLHLPSSHARNTTRLPTPAPITEPMLAARPNLTSQRRHPARRPIPQRRPHRRLRPSSLPLPLMRLRAPLITSQRLLLPRPETPQRRTCPLPRRRPSPLPLSFMFLRALKTAPRPPPPPLAWLWVLPTVPRRLPLPPPTLVWMVTGLDHASAAGTSAPQKPPVINGAHRHTGRNLRILGIDEDVNIDTMICLISAQIPRSGAEEVGQGSRLRLLGRLPCSACFAVCCGCACLVALALLLAVFV